MVPKTTRQPGALRRLVPTTELRAVPRPVLEACFKRMLPLYDESQRRLEVQKSTTV